jgi:hypothetical protein
MNEFFTSYMHIIGPVALLVAGILIIAGFSKSSHLWEN